MSALQVGPFAFRKRSPDTVGTPGASRTGGLWCDCNGCRKSGAWIASIMGWDAGIYCTTHRDEWLATAERQGREPEQVAA